MQTLHIKVFVCPEDLDIAALIYPMSASKRLPTVGRDRYYFKEVTLMPSCFSGSAPEVATVFFVRSLNFLCSSASVMFMTMELFITLRQTDSTIAPPQNIGDFL